MPQIDLLNHERTELYKTAINSAIDTYPLEWRVILEPLQNSIDAIDKNDKVTEGQIDVTLDITENKVIIKDNGIGFPLKEDLFYLHGGTKTNEKKSKGKIGVGLKVTIFSSKLFYINSTFKDETGIKKSWNGNIEDAHKYKDKKELKAEMSGLQETTSSTGTTISYSFPDNSVLEFIKNAANSSFNEIQPIIEKSLIGRFKKAVEYFFRTNSYAADTNRLINDKYAKKININIKIKYTATPIGLEEWLSTLLKDANGEINLSFENKFWDIEEEINKQKGVNKVKVIEHKFYDKGTAYGRFDPDRVIWIRHFTDKAEIKGLLPNKYKDTFDELIKKINGIYIALGTPANMRKFYFKHPNTFISINGIPSDHILPNPTSNTPYAKLVLCIIDIDSTFNYGKLQTTNRTLISQCFKFYLNIYNSAISKVGEKAFGKNMEEDTSATAVEKSTNITNLENLSITLSFKKVPIDENSLIAIFFELIGKGIVKDYNFYSLHAKRKYDATAMIKTENMNTILTPNNDDDLKNVEFKLKLSELLDDINDGNKVLKEITLIIIWEDDISTLKDNPYEYEVIDLEDSKDKNSGFFGVKKVLMNKLDGTERQIFVMKEFINSLKKAP